MGTARSMPRPGADLGDRGRGRAIPAAPRVQIRRVAPITRVVRGSRPQLATAGSRLFAVYAVASLVPVLVLGLVLFRDYRREALDRALDQGRAQAAVIEEMAIAPVLGRRDLGWGVTARERSDLLDATDLAIFSGSVVRLRVRSFSGRVVFSDDGSSHGALAPSHPDFRAAASGSRVAALVPDSGAVGGQVIRVLEPIVSSASGQATGVLEVYLPYARIAAKVDAQLHRTYRRLAGVLGALYLVLALISWSSSRRLRRYAAEREHQALHDALTQLPNRERFHQRAERAVRDGAAAGGAVVLVDLDRFKEVNDTLGHAAGDELLRVVGRRLRVALREEDIVARLGGDEFGLVLPGVADPDAALAILVRLREELSAEIRLEALTVGVEASFGVALYPRHGDDLEALLQRADAAMYQGKRSTSGIVVFEAELAPAATHSLVVQGEVRQALERDELLLHYQPKLDLATGSVCGVEALVRWQHPRRGLLGPGAFLPAVEQSGLIEPLTSWVLRRALEDHRGWRAAGAAWPVSVNVSARNLGSPQFAEAVMRLLRESGTAPAELCLEVTETALAADAELAARTLHALAERGVAISLDDFGMGYTSLSHLRTLPVAEIKLDRAFVAGVVDSEQDRSIVRSVVELGHGLGSRVTAEGVEDAAVAHWLHSVACDSAQGWFFARPAPWPELLDRFAAPAGERLAPLPTREAA